MFYFLNQTYTITSNYIKNYLFDTLKENSVVTVEVLEIQVFKCELTIVM